ncbi:hypothetical protein ACFXJO_12955 [Streptomyces lavendulae]|uniref:hypothetical protein n=1 Tax=Streptomyces lavendulae TaxID=1914 RepID=UPI0036B238FA
MSARDRVYAVTEDGPLPWQAGHPLRSVALEPGYGWQHVVYGGTYALRAVRDTLLRVFGESEEDHDGRMDGESALYALTVTDDGRILLDSPVFSSCGWATGRALFPGSGKHGWLDGFAEEADAWHSRAGEVSELAGPYPAQEPTATDPSEEGDAPRVGNRTVSAGQLLEFTGELARAWGLDVALEPAGVRVRSVPVRLDRADDGADQQDFLNSFIAADLDRVARALGHDDPGPALAAYLTPEAAFDTARRVDVRAHPAFALAGVAPGRTPLGRWPADAAHPLALSQQFAVNAVHTDLAPAGGIFAVNGPPGTGKTTMLRDCFAAAVVERARRLAALCLPSQASPSRPRTSGRAGTTPVRSRCCARSSPASRWWSPPPTTAPWRTPPPRSPPGPRWAGSGARRPTTSPSRQPGFSRASPRGARWPPVWAARGTAWSSSTASGTASTAGPTRGRTPQFPCRRSRPSRMAAAPAPRLDRQRCRTRPPAARMARHPADRSLARGQAAFRGRPGRG